MKFIILLTLIIAITASVPNNTELLRVELYIESLCPFCINFIATTFAKANAVEGFYDMVNFTVYPFGNAQETQVGNSSWNYTCQHGPMECYGNQVENCAKYYYTNSTNFLDWLICVEGDVRTTQNFDVSGQNCSEEHGLDWTEVQKCATGELGMRLTHKAAAATNNLNPHLAYVPYIVVNGKHDVQAENEINDDFVQWACQNYGGDKPSVCGQYQKEFLY